jgi:hypothetical protein
MSGSSQLVDDMLVFTDNAEGEIVTWEVTAQDNVDGTATLHRDNTLTQDNVGGDIDISCNPSSGTKFLVTGADQRVDCTATDAAGNEASGSFLILVDIVV